MPLKDVVDCVVNNEKVHLTKEDLALSNTKVVKIGLQNKTNSQLYSHCKFHQCFKFSYMHYNG